MIGIRDTLPHPAPEFTLPEPGVAYDDPAFGGRLRRLTGPADGARCSGGYSNVRGFSANSRYFTAGIDDEAWLYGLDPDTGVSTKLRRLLEGSPITTPIQWDVTFWDARLPTVCYVVEPAKQRIWSVDLSKVGAAQFDVVRRFNHPGELVGCTIWQHSCSDDGKVWAFHAIDATGAKRASVWFRDLDLLYFYPAGANAAVNECQISPDGEKVRVFFDDETCVLWDPGTATRRPIGALIDHADWATRAGPGILFASGDKASGENAITLRSLDALGTAVPIWSPRLPDGTVNWSLADHVSMPPGKDWCIVSAYLKLMPVGSPRPWNAFEGEIIQVYFDGRVRRLCHHRTEGVGGSPTVAGAVTRKDADGNPLGYWCQPRACVSRCGRFVLYTALIDGRLDVFLLEVPPDDDVLEVQDELVRTRIELDRTRLQLDDARRIAEREVNAWDALAAKIAAAKAALE